jgi:1-aminocyclopropane-1-carboxylate deaminase/D-cysteine desulfhydrase-like pyridoxal-dependent ACC family enzyme
VTFNWLTGGTGFVLLWYQNLTNDLKEKLVKEGRKPYVIPVGGSNSLGTW